MNKPTDVQVGLPCPACNNKSLKISSFDGALVLACLNCKPGAVLYATAKASGFLDDLDPGVTDNVIQGPWQNNEGGNIS